jgi:hypothetical protein
MLLVRRSPATKPRLRVSPGLHASKGDIMRRPLGALALALILAAASTASAHAAPQWLSNGKPTPVGVVVPVATKGKLSMTLIETRTGRASSIRCRLTDEEKIHNAPSGGTDEFTSFAFSKCTFKPSPCPAGATAGLTPQLPWRSDLVAGSPIKDAFQALVRLSCGGKSLISLEGVLEPQVGMSTLTFSAAGGSLAGPPDYVMQISGIDKLKGPKGDRTITAA